MRNETPNRIASQLRIAGVATYLMCLFSVPILFLVYGGLAAALGGVGFILVFAALQLPVFLLLRKIKLMPKVPFGLPNAQDAESDQLQESSQQDLRSPKKQ